MRIVEMVRNDIKKSSLLRTKILIYAFNGRTIFFVYIKYFSDFCTLVVHAVAVAGLHGAT